jgi:CubicO group peptidase (beta-lactamase class C family)
MSRGSRVWILVALTLGLVVLAGLGVFLSAPHFWERYLSAATAPAAPLPAWYQPRELVAGDSQPPAPHVTPELESLDARALANAAAYADAHDTLSLIVARHDHVVFERYWHDSNFDTLIDSRSFTRVLATVAAGVAVAHRRIAWPDEPVRYFLPEWRSDPRGAISVRNLMQLASGLAPAPASRAPWSAAARALFGTELTADTLARPLAGVPGHTWAAQSTDPQLLSLIIERATGQRYATYLSQVLWRRIGAGNAWLYLDRPGGAAHADCCMVARQGDWLRVGELLVGEGNYRGYEIVRPGWVQLMRQPAPANVDFGAALRLSAAAGGGKAPYMAPDTYALDGGEGTFLWVVPSLHLVVLRTASRRQADFDESRIPNLIVSGARDFVPPAARPGRDLSGIVPGH